MSKFHLRIVTPRGIYKEIDVDMLNIRTTNGYIGVLAHHIPLATGVEISEMNYKIDGQKYEFAIAGGFLYVGDNEVTVIGNAVESPEEIDLRRAQEAEKRAKERLSSTNSQIDIQRAEMALKKALVRQNVKGLQ